MDCIQIRTKDGVGFYSNTNKILHVLLKKQCEMLSIKIKDFQTLCVFLRITSIMVHESGKLDQLHTQSLKSHAATNLLCLVFSQSISIPMLYLIIVFFCKTIATGRIPLLEECLLIE